MWELVRSVFGEVTANELILVALMFSCILCYGLAPRLGELIGGMFDQDAD